MEYLTGWFHKLKHETILLVILDLFIYFRYVSKNDDEKRYILKYFGFGSFSNLFWAKTIDLHCSRPCFFVVINTFVDTAALRRR